MQKYRSHGRHIFPREDEVASRQYWQHFILHGLELSKMKLGVVKGILLLDQFLDIHQFSYILHHMGLLWANLFMFGDIPL